MRGFAFVAVLITALSANAQVVAPRMQVVKFGTRYAADDFRVLSGIAGNAAAADRTFTAVVAGLSKVTVWVTATEGGTISGIGLTCSASPDMGATYASIPVTSISGGQGSVVPYSDLFPTTVTATAMFEYDVRTFDKFKCLIVISGGGASDSIRARMTGAVGQ